MTSANILVTSLILSLFFDVLNIPFAKYNYHRANFQKTMGNGLFFVNTKPVREPRGGIMKKGLGEWLALSTLENRSL